jgi:hypothetical protein
MTTFFEELTRVVQIVLKARGQWHEGAPAYADVERALRDCAEAGVRSDQTPDQNTSAITELIRK